MQLRDLVTSLTPHRIGDRVFEADPYDRGAGVVDAGTVAGLIVAAAGDDGAPIRSMHATFFRSAVPTGGLTLTVDDIHAGRTLGVRSVSVAQGRQIAVAHVVVGPAGDSALEHATGPDMLPPVPNAPTPQAFSPHPGFATVVGDVNPFDADGEWPPTWQVWVDCDGVPPGTSRTAFVAFHANEYLVSAAVLPHRGFGMGEAHRGMLTVITSSDVVFHDLSSIERWLLFEQTSTFAGAGWVYGRGAAYTESGLLVASFSQQAILRPTAGQHPSLRSK
ncbi:acyl-CoA thioesterase II [Mycobacterium sp. E1747]|uniref:acyl-CoA thioesterase n=1 Tax=Mycobacterium sp. E1747 TaxID=1834128 RepID=UPI0007FD6892|nr:thioesterase family protein [Mycobacterium sp. E1747]OBH05912.1 hypothetical protein A5695_06665 [Mycobacterium sp. E1747]